MTNTEKGTIGYAPGWPFEFVYDGQEWISNMNPVTEFFWTSFIAPFWDGTIKIRKGRGILSMYGNPQFGAAKNVPKENRKIYDSEGKHIGTLIECKNCGGLYWAMCPCGGIWRYNADPPTPGDRRGRMYGDN